jgi:hypothetical protein
LSDSEVMYIRCSCGRDQAVSPEALASLHDQDKATVECTACHRQLDVGKVKTLTRAAARQSTQWALLDPAL